MRVLPDPELTPEELEALKNIRDTDHRKTVRERAYVILLAHKGYQGKEIAKILDKNPKTISTILKRWGFDRLHSVTKKKHEGKKAILIPEYIDSMLGWLKEEPKNYGYARTTWTCQMLTDQLKEQFNIEIGQERVRQVLHKHKWSYKQPTLQPPTAPLAEKKKPKGSSWTY
jgi:transposase